MMVHLRIDGIEVRVPEGATLLDAARAAGIDIPTLCWTRETGARTSCMVCVVKDGASGRLMPSCAARAVEGADIVTQDGEVHAARRDALAMLLDEHAGDCEAPCARICPAGLNIPRMLRYAAAGDSEAAARVAKRDLIFPATLGRLCPAPCEKGCRRALYDAPLGIRAAHREAADSFIERAPSSGKSVAVVGAGLTGLAAAWTCAVQGHACVVYEKGDRACAALAETAPEQLPRETLEAEIASVFALGVTLRCGVAVGKTLALDALLREHDALIIACELPFADVPRVFAARAETMHVRAVASGKRAAREADAWLGGQAVPPHRSFNAMLGKLDAQELAAYAVERLQFQFRGHHRNGVPEIEIEDAARCLHCDCLKPATCKLRQFAEAYGLAGDFKRLLPRPAVQRIERSANVLFDPGKCIKCGICVELTRLAGISGDTIGMLSPKFGMTMTGRGIASRVRPAMGATLEEGLGSAAADCVRECPTGALAFRDAEETA